VTPLPLIDSGHEAASSVPIAKLKRRVITSPSAARAMVSGTVTQVSDIKRGHETASRPATATAAAKKPASQTYARSHLYGSADPTWRVTGKIRPLSDECALPVPTHDLSDSFMKQHIKQVAQTLSALMFLLCHPLLDAFAFDCSRL
jgi:hypothetical protein